MTGIACVRAQDTRGKCLEKAQNLALKYKAWPRHAALRERTQIYEKAFDRANGAGIGGRRVMYGTVHCPHQPSQGGRASLLNGTIGHHGLRQDKMAIGPEAKLRAKMMG